MNLCRVFRKNLWLHKLPTSRNWNRAWKISGIYNQYQRSYLQIPQCSMNPGTVIHCPNTILISKMMMMLISYFSFKTNRWARSWWKLLFSYHTSILPGPIWVLELLNGHPDRIHSELGVQKHIFQKFIEEFSSHGYLHPKHIMLKEQLSIFLYMCVTGLSYKHVGQCLSVIKQHNIKVRTFFFLVSH